MDRSKTGGRYGDGIERWARRVIFLLLSVVVLQAVAIPARAAAGDDAGTGRDAGDTRQAATKVIPRGTYAARLESDADAEDWFTFPVVAGAPINIEVRGPLVTGSLPPPDYLGTKRLQFQLLDPNGVVLDTPYSNPGDSRVGVPAAPSSGNYYFRATRQSGFSGRYEFCFANGSYACPPTPMGVYPQPIGSSTQTHLVRVLLVPPAHGDLGNPLGPTALQYLDATLTGIREWEWAAHEFARDHPQFGYLRRLKVEVLVADTTDPAPADIDVVIAYVPTGSHIFRGFAGQNADWRGPTPQRYIALSTYSASPRAGQMIPDYPEWNDLHAVTLHEFGHTFGIGHTLTWTHKHGPDLMNSPATFVYGDGNPVLDGGERTPRQCLSSLNLYSLARLYRWLPAGTFEGRGETVSLPPSIPYRLYCPKVVRA